MGILCVRTSCFAFLFIACSHNLPICLLGDWFYSINSWKLFTDSKYLLLSVIKLQIIFTESNLSFDWLIRNLFLRLSKSIFILWIQDFEPQLVILFYYQKFYYFTFLTFVLLSLISWLVRLHPQISYSNKGSWMLYSFSSWIQWVAQTAFLFSEVVCGPEEVWD